MMVLSAQISQPNMTTPTGSVISILLHYAMVGTRTEDARADIILGARFIYGARHGLCPVASGSGQDCTHHYVIGAIILVAACVDLTLESLWFQFFEMWFAPESMRRVTVNAHIGMFFCELTILGCALYVSTHGLTAYGAESPALDIAGGGQGDIKGGGANEKERLVFAGAESYAIMCCCTTVVAMVYIVLLVAVPESAWKRLKEWGLEGLVSRLVSNSRCSRASSKVTPHDAGPVVSTGGTGHILADPFPNVDAGPNCDTKWNVEGVHMLRTCE
jgi:hypothetical protein